MPNMPATFVSHSKDNVKFCRKVVQALRQAGADVWYDEHNLSSGALLDVIQRELHARPIFVVILSPAALKSHWVLDECKWAYTLWRANPARQIVPVVASRFQADQLPLHLQDFRRIEASPGVPFSADEAVQRLVQMISRTEAMSGSASDQHAKAELVAKLLAEGEAIQASRPEQAIALFEQARRISPNSGAVWFHLGYALYHADRLDEALEAFHHAVTYDPKHARSWEKLGDVLMGLHRDAEGLVAYNQALAIDGRCVGAWIGKGNVFYNRSDYDEALDAYDQAVQIDPQKAEAWTNIGDSLSELGRPKLALDAYEAALAIDPADADTWEGKQLVLEALGWTRQADQAAEQVRILRSRQR